MIAHPSLLARKYAYAYLNRYGAEWSFDTYQRLSELADFLQQHHAAVDYFTIAATSQEIIQRLFEQLIARFEMPESLRKLFNLLWKHKRLFILSEVMAALCYEYRKKYGIQVWTISSSHPLSNEQIEIIKKQLARRTGKIIEINIEHDAQLIAGIRLQSDTLAFEHSINKQLQVVMALKDIR